MEQHNTCHWKICIDIHDVWGMLLLLFLFLYRNVPLDNSSLWQVGVLCVIYLLSRLLDKRFILVGIAVWSIIEGLLAILQKLGCLSSGHPIFEVTGSFGNPGPLGGILCE